MTAYLHILNTLSVHVYVDAHVHTVYSICALIAAQCDMAFNLADMSCSCIINCGWRKGRAWGKNTGSLYANTWPWLVRAHLCPYDNRRSKETEWYRERCRERSRLILWLASGLLWGKTLAGVNNAQLSSRLKLDANCCPVSLCVPHCFLSNVGVSLFIPFLYWCFLILMFSFQRPLPSCTSHVC